MHYSLADPPGFPENRAIIFTMGNSRERILVVENDPVIRDLIARQALQAMGYQVLPVSDGNSAISQAAQFAPDVMIVDLDLPGLSGKDFMAAMAAQGVASPMIVLAHQGHESHIIQAFRLGATDYLQWPVRDAEVVSVVERALKQVRERRERETLVRQLQTANQDLQHRVYELTAILAIGKSITSVTDKHILFDKIIDGAIKVTHGDIGWLLLHDETLKTYILAAQRHLPLSMVKRPWEDSISSLMVLSGEPLSIAGESLKRFNLSDLGQAALIVPIKAQKQILGGLVVLRQAPKPFDSSEKNLLVAVSDYASISLINARLFRALNEQASALQTAVEQAGLNEKINTDRVRVALKTFRPPVTASAEIIDRILQGQAGTLPDDQARYLLTIQEKLLELTQALETADPLQHPTASIQAAPANLTQLSRQAIQTIQRTAQHNHLIVVGEFPVQDVIIRADAAQVYPCILGLLSNAIKFSPPGQTIALQVFQNKPMAHLVVKDGGAGISPRQLPHLFEPEFAHSTPPIHEFSGLGIRLSLIKEVIIAQGGKIWAESHPGQGLAIHVTLALARPG